MFANIVTNAINLETNLEKYKKIIRLLEERNWEELKKLLHEEFIYIK
tara:strand:+ start:48 stop:188 length:141 start_codon:yes stop_codon:yes gene_type:complete